MALLNSKEYWDERFSSESWDENAGPRQTSYFAKIACALLPEFLKLDLMENPWTVVDVGCAEGDAIEVFAAQFPNCRFVGQDVSDEAVQRAKARFPGFEFAAADIYEKVLPGDVVFSSNTLEHLENPLLVMKNMCEAASKYVVLLLPFEDGSNCQEHINFFTLKSFPLHLGSFYLEYSRLADCSEIEGDDWRWPQILLVYTNANYRPERMTLQEVHSQYSTTCLNIGELCQHLEITKNEHYRMLMEKDRLLTERDEVANQKDQLARQLQETAAKLQTACEENGRLEKELEERNFCYNDLYAYSSRRDKELEDLTNSRSYRFFIRFIKKPLHIGYCAALKIKRMVIFLFTFRWGLLGAEILSPFRKIALRIRRRLKRKTILTALSGEIAGRDIIIFPPTLDWNMMLFQRPQQLAAAYAQKPNTTVIYLTANLKHDHVALAEQARPHLWLVFSGCFQEVLPLLKRANRTVMSLSWTINKPYVDMLKPEKLIYEYIDELEIFDKYDEQMVQEHQALMRMADVTVCTATKLFNQADGHAKNPILSPNAGDYSFFSKTSQYEISPLLQNKIGSYRSVLGYYGALASWFDYELVMEIAQRRPDWLFVLVGMDYDGTLGKSGVLEYDNILYIPPQPYQELPRFLKAFDIAMIPFVINEITLSTSPVKLFEYMAAGKPILTSPMPECLKYESVRTYQNADEFCDLAEELLDLKPEDPYWEILRREALENTWDARTDEILEEIGLKDR